MTHHITLIAGDGVGPEVTGATRRLIDALGIDIVWHEHLAGAQAFAKDIASGIPEETLDSIRSTRVVLKGPLETPVGHGGKSANVTLRKCFETFANVRPVRNIPGISTPYDNRTIDFVLVRENVEDLYAGIEFHTSPITAESVKLITQQGCEKICRFAFEVARAEGRSSVHCATKANILKLTEGMMKRVFEAVSADYPDIAAHHMIVDNCAHMLVRAPEDFEVLVMTNINGDILSDLASGLVGGLGVAPGANIGHDVAIFEAVHGSAPTIAGKDIVNPMANMLTGVMLLRHLGEMDAADRAEAAIYAALSAGEMTSDIAPNGAGLSTSAFTDAVLAHLDTTTVSLPRAHKELNLDATKPKLPEDRLSATCVGVDVFVNAPGASPRELGDHVRTLTADMPLQLKLISSRGIQVYPDVGMRPAYIDSWRCRFMHPADADQDTRARIDSHIAQIVAAISPNYEWTTVRKLLVTQEGAIYSKAQGESD